MVLYIPNIIELIGLGLAIDYSLLIVQRFRRECERGDIDSAIKATMFSAAYRCHKSVIRMKRAYRGKCQLFFDIGVEAYRYWFSINHNIGHGVSAGACDHESLA